MNKNISRAIAAAGALVVLSGTLGNGPLFGVLKAFGYGGHQVMGTPTPSPSVSPTASVSPSPSASVSPTASPVVSKTPTPTPVIIRRPVASSTPVVSVSATPTPAASVSVSPTVSTTPNGLSANATSAVGDGGSNIFSKFWHWFTGLFN